MPFSKFNPFYSYCSSGNMGAVADMLEEKPHLLHSKEYIQAFNIAYKAGNLEMALFFFSKNPRMFGKGYICRIFDLACRQKNFELMAQFHQRHDLCHFILAQHGCRVEINEEAILLGRGKKDNVFIHHLFLHNIDIVQYIVANAQPARINPSLIEEAFLTCAFFEYTEILRFFCMEKKTFDILHGSAIVHQYFTTHFKSPAYEEVKNSCKSMFEKKQMMLQMDKLLPKNIEPQNATRRGKI